MACCLTLAVLFAVVRKIVPGQRGSQAFAPPARRVVGSSEDVGGGVTTEAATGGAIRAEQPSSVPAVLVGWSTGALAYLSAVLLLRSAGVLAGSVVGAEAVAAVATIAALVVRSRRGAHVPIDPFLVLGTAGLTFGALGLLDMHLLQAIRFTSPSWAVDIVWHAAGPAVSVGAILRQSAIRATGLART